MLPQTNNNNQGGLFGRATSGAGDRRGVARADDLRVLVNCAAVMVLVTCLLATNASELWPQLFPQAHTPLIPAQAGIQDQELGPRWSLPPT